MKRWLGGLLGEQAVPAEILAQSGARAGRVIWSADLSQWAPDLRRGALLFIAEVTGVGGELQDVVFFSRGDLHTPLGSLRRLFPGAPVAALLLDTGAERVIVGRIDKDMPGRITHLDLERVEPQSTRWMEAVRSSTLHDRVFLIPIPVAERIAWEKIARLTLDSRESLVRGWQRRGKHTAVDFAFEPPLDLSAAAFNLP